MLTVIAPKKQCFAQTNKPIVLKMSPVISFSVCVCVRVSECACVRACVCTCIHMYISACTLSSDFDGTKGDLLYIN